MIFSERPPYVGGTAYLVPNGKIGSTVKSSFSFPTALPPIISLPHLIAVAGNLPATSFAQLLQIASLAPSQAPYSDNALLWYLYEKIPATAEKSRYQSAKKLTQLYKELDDSLPVHYDKNPFAAITKQTTEKTLAEKIWLTLAKTAPSLLRPKGTILAALADTIQTPLIAVVNEETTPLEKDFYRLCKAKILTCQPPLLENYLANQLTAKPPPPDAGMPLPHTYEASGDSLTETAILSLHVIRHFLHRQKGDIGIVVYDRLLARRLRVIAEEDNILIQDNLGWRAETLSIGAALLSFVAVGGDDFSPTGALEWLHPPFFANTPSRPIAEKQWREQLLQSLNLPKNLNQWAEQAKPELSTIASSFADARKRAPQQATVKTWLDWLIHESVLMLAAWQDDPIYVNLCDKLYHRAMPEKLLTHSEFTLWLEDNLAEETCPESDIESPIQFISPSSQKEFSAILLLGYTDKPQTSKSWLTHADKTTIEKSLNIPHWEDTRTQQMRQQFCRLISKHSHVAAVWRRVGETGEPIRPHPLWQSLTLLCKNNKTEKFSLPQRSPSTDKNIPIPATATLQHWPSKLSITAAEQLITCPYLFYTTSLLKLKDNEEYNDSTPAFFGKLMHKILQKFSDKTDGLLDTKKLATVLQQIIDEETKGNRPELKLQATYWKANAEKFIAWEATRRNEGWQTAETEHPIKAQWQARNTSHPITFSGRIDRLDQNNNDEWEIIDYKSGTLPSKKELQCGEKPQLPLYAYLYQAKNYSVHQQILCRPFGTQDKIDRTNSDSPTKITARIRTVLQSIAQGQKMPANGITCAKCRASGVCRREHW